MDIQYPLVIDGGLSNQLESQGHDLNHKLWSARLLDTDPDAIKKAHMAYLEAGARCVITASYQAAIRGFTDLGYNTETAETLIQDSVKIARNAVNEFDASRPGTPKSLVAASIGPYGAYLADGSEYRGNYRITDQALKDFHRPRMVLLDRSGADFLACETIPSFQEAFVLADLLSEAEKSTWVSFSCRDGGHINDGTPIGDGIGLFASHPRVFAVGINCTPPEHISSLIREIRKKSRDKKIVVYPNSGEVYHAESKTWSDTSDLSSLSRMVHEWMDLGADIIGGCCRMGPQSIQVIADTVRTSSHRT